MTISELRSRQEEIKSRLKELDEEFAGRELPEDNKNEWEGLEEEFERNGNTLRELEFRQERVAEIAGNPKHEDGGGLEPPQISRPSRDVDIFDLTTIRASVGGPQEATREMHDRAKRAIERAYFPHEAVSREDAQSHVERLLQHDDEQGTIARRILTTGSPTYNRAFTKAILGQHLNESENRALSLAGEFGGFAVPYTLDPTVIPTSNGVVNPIRQLARVENITTDTWKGVSSAGTKAAYSGEAEETEEAEWKFTQPEVSAERASVLLLASFEITQDWAGIQSQVARAIQDAKDTLEAEKFLEGTGEKEPYGLLTGATETKETSEEKAFKIGDLYTLKGALPPRFQPGAAWLANDAQFDRVRQFDTSGGSGLWVYLKEGRPAQLLGKPAYEMSTMNATTEKGKEILVYGDFNYYLIAERIGVNIEVIPHVMNGKKATGQRGFYAFWRNGAKVLTKNAFRTLKVK